MRLFFLLLFVLVSVNVKPQAIELASESSNHFTITKNQKQEFSFVNSIANIDSRIIKTKSGSFVKLIISFLR